MTIHRDIIDAIGNTPLIRLSRMSEATGCDILGKAEFMNPGQSVTALTENASWNPLGQKKRAQLASRHTAIINRMALKRYVLIANMKRVIAQASQVARGLGVAIMPPGSPEREMPGAKPRAFNVIVSGPAGQHFDRNPVEEA